MSDGQVRIRYGNIIDKVLSMKNVKNTNASVNLVSSDLDLSERTQ